MSVYASTLPAPYCYPLQKRLFFLSAPSASKKGIEPWLQFRMQLGEPFFLFYLQLHTATCTQLPPSPPLGPSCFWISDQGAVTQPEKPSQTEVPRGIWLNWSSSSFFCLADSICYTGSLGPYASSLENSPQTWNSQLVQLMLFPGSSQKCVLSERKLALWKKTNWRGSFQKTSLTIALPYIPFKTSYYALQTLHAQVCSPLAFSDTKLLDLLHDRAFVHAVSAAQETLHSFQV